MIREICNRCKWATSSYVPARNLVSCSNPQVCIGPLMTKCEESEYVSIEKARSNEGLCGINAYYFEQR